MADIPKWAIPAGVFTLGIGAYLVKKSRDAEKKAERAASEATAEAPTQPIIYENPYESPYGYGYGGEAIGNAIESERELQELLRQSQTASAEERRQTELSTREERQKAEAAINEAIAKIPSGSQQMEAQTGGGTPSTTQAGGPTPSPEQSPAATNTTVEPPKQLSGAAWCARVFQNFPFYNPAEGNAGPHSCYKDGCRNKQLAHEYKDGHVVTVGGPC